MPKGPTLAIVCWAFLIAGLIAMVFCVELLVVPSNRNAVAPIVVQVGVPCLVSCFECPVFAQPASLFSRFVSSGSWTPYYPAPSTFATYGLVRLDNSLVAQAPLVALATPGQNVSQSDVYGQLRLEGFEFTWPIGTLPFLVLQDVDSSFLTCPCSPLNRSVSGSSVSLGNIQFMGSYNCLFGLRPFGKPLEFATINAARFYMVAASGQYWSSMNNPALLSTFMNSALVAANVSASRVVSFAILGVARMQFGNTAVRANATLGLAQYFDTRNVMGV